MTIAHHPEQELARSIGMIGARRRRKLRLHLLLVAAGVAAFAIAFIAWHAVPFGERHYDALQWLAWIARMRDTPGSFLIALATYAIGGLLVLPINLLIAATVVVFGPAWGSALALAGCVLNAALLYELGRRAPARLTRLLERERIARVIERLAARGVLTVAIVRALPLAPYSVVNYLAGAARVRRRDFLIGTALGLAPGIALYALFADRAMAVLVDPRPSSFAWLALIAALLVGVMLLLRRWLLRRRAMYSS